MSPGKPCRGDINHFERGLEVEIDQQVSYQTDAWAKAYDIVLRPAYLKSPGRTLAGNLREMMGVDK
jgi:hypothetical protein